jgi:hypothetical protein
MPKWALIVAALCTAAAGCGGDSSAADGGAAGIDTGAQPNPGAADGHMPTAGAPAGGGTGGHATAGEAAEPPAQAGTAAPGVDGGSAGEADAGAPAEPLPPPDVAHTFEELTIAPGEERTGLCQSWTLNNDTPLYVNRVVATNQGGLHHSNWIWVDEASYAGPDGSWPCADRGFDQIFAGAVGGVFFAQSTQSRQDTQAFPEGVAFEMPAHVRIIGDVHLLNPLQTEATTSLHFDIYTLPEADVRVRLQPMAFTNTALEIAAAGDTSARMQCATPQPDFDIYYVLPHFHDNGRGMRVDVAGGPMDAVNVFTSDGAFGEPLGRTFDPPIPVRGALGLGITCDYRNESEAVLHYGVGDQEMCVVLIYSTGKKAGGMAIANLTAMDVGGVHETDAACIAVGTP